MVSAYLPVNYKQAVCKSSKAVCCPGRDEGEYVLRQ